MSTELRLHRELYAEGAIAEAIATYAGHAKIERRDDGDHTIVSIDSERPGRAAKVARELGNYALGRTIETRTSEVTT